MAETSCKKCCFAVWSGETQAGCRFGRTEKVESKRVESHLVVPINCNAYRPTDSEFAISTPPEKRQDKVAEEIKIGVDLIVLVDDVTEFQDIRDIIAYADGLEEKFLCIHVMNYASSSIPPAKIRDQLAAMKGGTPWKITRLTASLKTHDDAILQALPFCQGKYLAIVNICPDPSIRIPELINTAINEDLKRFTLLYNTFVVVHKNVYKQYHDAIDRVGEDPRYADSENLCQALIWMGMEGKEEDSNMVVALEDLYE